MRRAVAIFAVIAALAAGAFFALPVLVDQEAIQRALRGHVAELTGQRLVIDGRFEVNLLPSPTITVSRALVRNDDPQGRGPEGDIDRIDLAVDLPGLLRGEAVIREMTVIRPVMRVLAGDPGEALAVLNLPFEARGRPAFARLSVVDGRIDIVAEDGGEKRIDAIAGEFSIDPETAAHGFALSGRMEGRDFSLGLVTSEPRAGRPAAVEGEWRSSGHRFGWRGQATAGPAFPLFSGEIEGSPAALADLAGLLGAGRLADLVRLQDIDLAGELEITADYAKITGGRATAGGVEAAVDLTLGPGGPGEKPAVEASVSFANLDLGDASDPWQWRRILTFEPPAGLTANVRAAVDRLTFRGLEFRRVQTQVTLDGDGGGRLETLRAILPGSGDFSLSGDIAGSSDGIRLDGSLSMTTEDLPGIREALVPGVRFVPVDAIDGMALDANVSIGPARAGLTEMRLRLDGSEIEGGFMLVDGERPQLAASLRIDRLDTGALFPRGEDDGTTGLGGLDGFRQWLAEFDHALDLIIDRANVGRFRLQGITVKSRVRDGGLIIEELAIGDALDATAHLSGVMDLDLSVIELDGSVAIASPARLLRDLGYDAPLVMSLLGPLRLDARMEGSAGRLNLSSTVEGDNIEGRFIAGGLPEAFDLEGELLAGSEGHVLAQLGALILDNPALAGDARLDFVWNGTQADPPAGRASLHLGDIALEGELALPAGDAARGSIEARNLDLGTAASFYRWLAPALGLIPGPLDRWIGAWPKQRLQWDWPFRRPVELAFSAIGPDGADLASGDLRLSADSVALLPLEFTLGGGHVVIRSAYVPPELDLRLTMGAVESGALLASLGVEGGLSGPLDLELDLRGTGATVPRILATLAGTGTMSVSAGRMALPAGADPYPAFLSLGGDIAVERGMFESIDGSFMLPPGIDAGPSGGMGPDLGTGETVGFQARLDLPAWIADIRLDLDPPLHAIGVPGRLAARILDRPASDANAGTPPALLPPPLQMDSIP